MALSGALDSVVGRAVRDQDFRARFLDAPLTAAEESGYALSSDDRKLLVELDREKASSFFHKMESQGTPMAWCSDKVCYEREPDNQDP